jgi:RimJ/RimL family protein N-acetyltransferase
MHRWFNIPHVQQFYSLRIWSESEVVEKLTPYITGEKSVFGFIILLNHIPIGYVQYYRLIDFPWPEQDLSNDIIKSGAGLDFFIGDENFIGKGWGTKILTSILKEMIWPKFDYCIVDPDIRNEAMIHGNEKVGFKKHKIIHTEDALKRPVELVLMIKKNNS